MIQGGGCGPACSRRPPTPPTTRRTTAWPTQTGAMLSIARTQDPHSASSQFFINVNDNTFLNHQSPTPQGWGYCVFGKVVEGMDTVNNVKEVDTTTPRGPRRAPARGGCGESKRRKKSKNTGRGPGPLAALFISDCHLAAARPGPLEEFLGLMAGPARAMEAVYILGDLFDLWLGDDDDAPGHDEVMAALGRAAAAGTAVYFMRGRRTNFLAGGTVSPVAAAAACWRTPRWPRWPAARCC
ncbi:MAG: peptidylprolyl isomerase [Gammaproteobacteria bacterium]|nr:peptidylprolyl isomerase [Gammaproteobacteria bacterium]